MPRNDVSERRFQIARGGQSAEGRQTGEVHTGTAPEKEEHKAGEIPKAELLFANAFWAALLLILLGVIGSRNIAKIPKGIGSFTEFLADALNKFVVGIIGPGGGKHTPFVGTLFLFILIMNLFGAIPILHSPTANLSITFALGIIVFVYVQFVGIRENGLIGHLKHFAGPVWWLAWLMFPVELVSELVKPFTLAVRLFGNIFGEDVIIGVMAGLGGKGPMGFLPIQFPVLLLSMLTAFVQAMIFCTLTCIYLSLVSHHDEGHAHDDHAAHQEAGLETAHAAGH